MSEQDWLLRVEGVNFAATLLDTDDLSTIRGAGLALLEAGPLVEAALQGAAVQPDRVFAGASQLAFRFQADPDTAAAALDSVRNLLSAQAEGQRVPLQHLMFVADLAPVPGAGTAAEEAALQVAEARNRARQFRAFTVRLPSAASSATRPDVLDHTRQAEMLGDLPGPRRVPLSYSVWDRRKYGVEQRRGFYAPYMPAPPPDLAAQEDAAKARRGLPVCTNLADMVDAPPRGLPVAPQRKLAYLYGDGNGFGAARQRLGARAFAEAIRGQQDRLLRRLTAWLAEGVAEADRRRAVWTDEGWQARFETLLWGGDDVLFVMPAWLGLAVLAEIEQATRAWQAGGQALSCAFGLAICDAKTPVRIARRTAGDLCDLAKQAAKAATPKDAAVPGSAAIQVFESQSPLDAPLAALRMRQFGVPEAEVEALGHRLVLRGDTLPGLIGTVRDLTNGSVEQGMISPPLLHRAIAAARQVPEGLGSVAADRKAQAVLDTALGRFGRRQPDIALHGFAPGGRGLSLDLCLLAMLRDYCAQPEQGDPPGFAEAA